MNINRRGFLTGLGALIAAPAVVRYANIMPVKAPRIVLPGTIYVDPAYAGLANGSSAAPFRTIQEAVDLVLRAGRAGRAGRDVTIQLADAAVLSARNGAILEFRGDDSNRGYEHRSLLTTTKTYITS